MTDRSTSSRDLADEIEHRRLKFADVKDGHYEMPSEEEHDMIVVALRANGVAHRDWFALAAEPDETILKRVREAVGYHFGVSDLQIMQLIRAAIPKEAS